MNSDLGIWRQEDTHFRVKKLTTPPTPGLRGEHIKVQLWSVTASGLGLDVKRKLEHFVSGITVTSLLPITQAY